MPNVEPVKLPSLSTKTMGFTAKELRKIVDGKPGAQFLFRVGGIVVEKFTGESKQGAWEAIKGIFTALAYDSKAYQSTVAFLPGSAIKKIADQLDQGVLEVQFLYDIYVTESEKSGVGYSYMIEPVLSDDAVKKMESLSSRVLGGKLPTLAIAAPAKKKV